MFKTYKLDLIHSPQADSSDLSEQSGLKSHFWIIWMQWPEARQTNSFSVQSFMGSVAGTEVPEVVGETVGKFPSKKEPNGCWAPGLRHSSSIMISPLATAPLSQRMDLLESCLGGWVTYMLFSRSWIGAFLSGKHEFCHTIHTILALAGFIPLAGLSNLD